MPPNNPASEMANLAERLCIADWEIDNVLQVEHRGTLPMHSHVEVLQSATPSPKLTKKLLADLHNPNAIWISHLDGAEVFPGMNAHLLAIAESQGLQKVSLTEDQDSHRRPSLATFRFTSR